MPTEFLSGGLVTSRDASLLQPGELSVAEDVLLKPGSPSLHKAPGRTRFNAVGLAAIDGLAYCGFDTTADKLAVAAGGSYYTAPAAETGSFTLLASGAGSSLDTAAISNRAVLMSGGTNRVLLKDGTSRLLGLAPVTGSLGTLHTASGGTGIFATLGTGYFDYWTTEAYIVGDEEVEGTFTGTPSTVNVTAAASTVTVTRPAPANATATHWRVYRSNRKTNAADTTGFPVGFLIGTIPIATDTFVDGGGNVFALTFAGSGTDTPPTEFLAAGWQDAGDWSSPGSVTADDGVPAQSPSVTYSGGVPKVATMKAGTFGFTGIGNPITDITVEVEAKRTGTAGLAVNLSFDGGQTWAPGRTVGLTSSYAVTTLTGMNFSRNWIAAETTNALFFVRLMAFPFSSGGSGTVEVDYVKVSISHGGTTIEQSVQFPAIIITAGPAEARVGANSQPPPATTGDVFQGSLVMNDVANPTNIIWTIPGTIDYAPVPYRFAFDTKERDEVRCIRTLGQVLCVGLLGQVHRMNFLPLEEDPEFNTGRAVDVIDSDEGIVGPRGAVKFILNGEPHLFYIGFSDLRMSNGYSAVPATFDIIWSDFVNKDALKKAHCENNSLYKEILVHYPAAGSAVVNKTLRLSYDPYHLKDGKLKVVGITNYGPAASAAGISLTGERLLYTAEGGFVYTENRGAQAANRSIVPRVSTREIHFADFGGAWELTGLLVHHQDCGPTAVDVSYTASQAGYDSETVSAGTFVPDGRRFTVVNGGQAGEGIIINLTGRDDGLPLILDYLVVQSNPLGETVSLKR